MALSEVVSHTTMGDIAYKLEGTERRKERQDRQMLRKLREGRRATFVLSSTLGESPGSVFRSLYLCVCLSPIPRPLIGRATRDIIKEPYELEEVNLNKTIYRGILEL